MKQLYLDLDGVFADFLGGVVKATGHTVEEWAWRGKKGEMWKQLTAIPNWFLTLEPTPYALGLRAAFGKYQPSFLTAVPLSIPSAIENKRKWVRQKLDVDWPVIGTRSTDKWKWSGKGKVLLDDQEKHKEKWVREGGVFVRHYQYAPGQVSIEKVEEAMAE